MGASLGASEHLFPAGKLRRESRSGNLFSSSHSLFRSKGLGWGGCHQEVSSLGGLWEGEDSPPQRHSCRLAAHSGIAGAGVSISLWCSGYFFSGVGSIKAWPAVK